MTMPTKDEVAERLARAHYSVDSGVSQIFRLMTDPEREADPREPIKLLEIYEHAIPIGEIVPIYFNPHPASGNYYPAEIIQIAPEEFEKLGTELKLPETWSISRPYERPDGLGGAPT
jgi:hypothetical protein